jgi:hypothetical protein
MLATGFVAVAIIAPVRFAPPAEAHHSFAMFDRTKLNSWTGTLKEFERTNPHSWLHVIIKDAAGVDREWSFEMGGLGQLEQQGLEAGTLKPGDQVTIEGHPLKDGSRGGMFRAVHVGGKLFHDANYNAARQGYPNAGAAAPNPQAE